MSLRTLTVLRQASFGLLFKVGGVGASFLAMPIALKALGSTAMGVWLVLLSMFQWITLFDLGIGAGARNEIARAAAAEDAPRLRRAVATGWFYTAGVSAAVLVAGAAALLALPLADTLSARLFGGMDVGAALWIVLAGACAAFALNFVQVVFAALEEPVVQSGYAFLSNLFFLGLLAAGRLAGIASIAQVAGLYAGAMMLAGLAILLRFRARHPALWPGPGCVDRGLRAAILGGGLRLFVIQLCALAIFTIDRLLVSAFVDPAAVVSYDAAFRLFALVTMTHALLMGSAWSSFTQAHARGEWDWIRVTMRRLSLLTLPVAVLALAMAAAAPAVVRAWLGPAQVGTPALYAAFALATVLGCWSNVFSYFLNAIGDTRAQIRSALVATAINIPAAWFFAVVLRQGAAGVVMGTCTAMMVFSVVGPFISRRRLAAVSFA